MWKDTLSTNVMGLCLMTRAAVEDMMKNSVDGDIIHINSLAGHRIPSMRDNNVYPASKYAVTALTETLRQELASVDSKIKVVGLARRKDKLQALAESLINKPGKFHHFTTDVANENEVLNAFKWIKEQLGPVHILINNAGIKRCTTLINGDTQMWKDTLNTNVMGLCVTTREAVKDMMKNNVDGAIIHINSLAGHRVASLRDYNVYPASKYAVTALTETLQQELASIGSKIKSISPGLVKTEMLSASYMMDLERLQGYPMMQPDDVAQAVMYVLSTPPNVQVVGLARRKDKLQALAESLINKPGKFHHFTTDVANENEVLNAFKWIKEQLGPVHILINNAGIKRCTTLINGDTQMWKDTLNTNVMGLCVTTREAVKDMMKNNVDGAIIHINSLAGHRVASIRDYNVYPASKYAVTALTETLQQELASIGSKIKSISPGLVKTEMLSASYVMDLERIQSYPMMQPDDVAQAVMYVLSTPPHVQVGEIKLWGTGKSSY
ncbi:hypothetical protein FQA39_LY03043 [Lamprigera yunnana]|nr:hypothetical protein FQA39_LY03043 [Lamprigera yunnana]